MTNIEEYYNWILANPKKVPKKIRTIYGRLVEKIDKPQKVAFLNKLTGEVEEHTYIFDIEKAQRPIKFIETYLKQSKGQWNGKPLKLELFQKAYIEALFGFVDIETRYRKYKKSVFFVARKKRPHIWGC